MDPKKLICLFFIVCLFVSIYAFIPQANASEALQPSSNIISRSETQQHGFINTTFTFYLNGSVGIRDKQNDRMLIRTPVVSGLTSIALYYNSTFVANKIAVSSTYITWIYYNFAKNPMKETIIGVFSSARTLTFPIIARNSSWVDLIHKRFYSSTPFKNWLNTTYWIPDYSINASMVYYDWHDAQVIFSSSYTNSSGLLALGFGLGTSFKIDPVVASSGSDQFGMYYTHQRHIWFAQTRTWVWSCNGTHLGYVYNTSNVPAFSAFTAIRTCNYGFDFATWSNSTHVIYAYSNSSVLPSTLYFRMGKLNAAGTITWSAVEQTAVSGTGKVSYPCPFLDSSGYPCIAYQLTVVTNNGYVIRSTKVDGTWTTDWNKIIPDGAHLGIRSPTAFPVLSRNFFVVYNNGSGSVNSPNQDSIMWNNTSAAWEQKTNLDCRGDGNSVFGATGVSAQFHDFCLTGFQNNISIAYMGGYVFGVVKHFKVYFSWRSTTQTWVNDETVYPSSGDTNNYYCPSLTVNPITKAYYAFVINSTAGGSPFNHGFMIMANRTTSWTNHVWFQDCFEGGSSAISATNSFIQNTTQGIAMIYMNASTLQQVCYAFTTLAATSHSYSQIISATLQFDTSGVYHATMKLLSTNLVFNSALTLLRQRSLVVISSLDFPSSIFNPVSRVYVIGTTLQYDSTLFTITSAKPKASVLMFAAFALIAFILAPLLMLFFVVKRRKRNG